MVKLHGLISGIMVLKYNFVNALYLGKGLTY